MERFGRKNERAPRKIPTEAVSNKTHSIHVTGMEITFEPLRIGFSI